MVGSVRLYLWGVRLHGGVLGYMVEYWVTWLSVGLHGGESWATW